jgi:adenosylhomocysteine nucleosidase
MRRLGIIAAFSGEVKPLVRGWKPLALSSGRKGDAAWQGRIGQTQCVAIASGMGREAAERASAMAEEAGELDGLISLGWAGALSCGIFPGRAYALDQVVDADTQECFATSFPASILPSGAPLKLVTIGHVAQAQEKRALAQTYRAVLVDMEAAAVARQAQAKSIPFYCFKAVTDAYGEVLPNFSQYTDDQGKLRIPALLAHIALRPKYWRPMARLGSNSKTGAEAIARALEQFVSGSA